MKSYSNDILSLTSIQSVSAEILNSTIEYANKNNVSKLDLKQPKNLMCYYGEIRYFKNYINDLNLSSLELYNKIADEISAKYDIIVVSKLDSSKENYEDDKSIIQLLKAKNMDIYGYIPIGTTMDNPNSELEEDLTIPKSLELSTIDTWIDEWIVDGATHIFLDEFGFDYNVTRQRQIDVVNLVHSKGMNYMANAWDFSHFAVDDISQLDNYINNDGDGYNGWYRNQFETWNADNLILPRILNDKKDTYMIESFISNDNSMKSSSELHGRMRTLHDFNVNNYELHAITIMPHTNYKIDYSKMAGIDSLEEYGKYLWLCSIMWGLTSTGSIGAGYGASNEYIKLPEFNLGFENSGEEYALPSYSKTSSKAIQTFSNGTIIEIDTDIESNGVSYYISSSQSLENSIGDISNALGLSISNNTEYIKNRKWTIEPNKNFKYLGSSGQKLGSSISISGQYMISSWMNYGTNEGSAYLFGYPEIEAYSRLTPADKTDDWNFALDTDNQNNIDGNFILSAHGVERAYVFNKYTELDKLIGSDNVAGDLLGTKVAATDKMYISSAPGRNTNSGAIYRYNPEFVLQDTAEVAIHTPDTEVEDDYFGSSLFAFDSKFIASTSTGKVFLFDIDTGDSEVHKFESNLEGFGKELYIDNDYIYISSNDEVSIYNTKTFNLVIILTEPSCNFGSSISTTNDIINIGADQYNSGDGAVFIYFKENFKLLNTLKGSDEEQLGYAMVADDNDDRDVLIVSAPLWYSSDYGGIYSFNESFANLSNKTKVKLLNNEVIESVNHITKAANDSSYNFTRTRFQFTSTGQTDFTGDDDNSKTLLIPTDLNKVDVYLEGVLLLMSDYTLTEDTITFESEVDSGLIVQITSN